MNKGRIAGWAAVAAFALGAAASAQTRASSQPGTPVAEVTARAPWNFGALVQGGLGVTDQRGGYKFLLLGGHAGKVLTPELGSGMLRGNFEYGVELFPLWQSYTPKFQKVSCTADPESAAQNYTCSKPYTVGGTFTGVSVTPIILRWNLTSGRPWMPWVQGSRRAGVDRPQVPIHREHEPDRPGEQRTARRYERLELYPAVRGGNPLFRPAAKIH